MWEGAVVVQRAEAGDGRRDAGPALVALLAGKGGRGDRSIACCRLILIGLDDLANHSQYTPHNVADSHLPGLGRHKSTTNIADARD